ncbi:NACHT domain-containing NTPase [Actinomadura sp. WMMB 499]|uniref:NACHT domain-containing protein n=1 Tax=Actinomadura sp. WMMB 499 TaxID=1219491 RepID=UPI00159E448D|nr:NACHT domain-containing protein [Actinomadura sp. WMMB 499]
MSLEVAAMRVGASVANLAVGRWLASRSARDGAGKELTELIKTGLPDELRRRSANRQIEGIADSVTERLLKFAGHEFRGLTGGDREAALHQIVLTLERADLSDDAWFAVDMDPVKLSRGLRTRLSARKAEFELGEAGARLYEVALDECCDCLARIIVHLAQFGPRASVETLSRLTDLSSQLNAVLSRLPVRTLTAPEGESEDEEFTRLYLSSLSENLDTLELLGVRFERFTRPQTTLSVAYISLNVSQENSRRRSKPEAIPISEWRGEHPLAADRVESVLADRHLTLVRGEAGGGKSTLLRWLAVTAARGAFTGPLAEWNGCVPFMIKLRSHPEGPLPRPEEYLDDVAGSLAGLMPRGWAHRRLLSGRAVLLVDGVDEVPPARRQAVRTWLKEIVNEFRGIRIIVTSRPAAAGADWLRAEGFTTTFLEPLSPSDVRALVDHWHDAVRDCDGLPCAPERLPGYKARLLSRLEAAPHLRGLASNPLLAAMLCALNLDREALPRNRMDLYGAALGMLLETRDTKRGLSSTLERDQKIRVLQDIAWHLSTSNRVELPKPMVERLVANRLATMPRVEAAPGVVLDELLQRSGVIREPVPGRIDFVHRTVQEYLTAKQAADLGDMDLLVRHAHRDTWRETIIMAAGHANEPLCRELLTGILDRARTERRTRRALKLLSVACLETVPSIPEDLRAELDRCLDELVPPRNEATARSLATAGPPVLARLPRDLMSLSEAAAAAVIQTAWLINGPEALTALSRFANDPRSVVQEELLRAWDYFDPREFADRVLSPMADAGALIEIIRSPEKLATLDVLPALSRLYIIFNQSVDFNLLRRHATTLRELTLMRVAGAGPADLPDMPNLKSLVLEYRGMCDVKFLDNFPELEGIWLSGCDRVIDFTPLRRHVGLRKLALHGGRNLVSFEELPSLRNLRALGLNESRLECGLAELVEGAPDLERLYLHNCEWVDNLTALANVPLYQLELNGCSRLQDIGPLGQMNDVTVLNLSRTPIRDVTPLVDVSTLCSVSLDGCMRISDISSLASLPNLIHLSIREVRPDIDLAPLAANRNLRVTIAPGQKVRGAEKLGRRLQVR